MGQMFFGTEFPNKQSDFHVVTDKFFAHCAGKSFVHINNSYDIVCDSLCLKDYIYFSYR